MASGSQEHGPERTMPPVTALGGNLPSTPRNPGRFRRAARVKRTGCWVSGSTLDGEASSDGEGSVATGESEVRAHASAAHA